MSPDRNSHRDDFPIDRADSLVPSTRMIVGSLSVGLAIRLLLCFASSHHTVWTDMASYRDIALNILNGGSLYAVDRPLMYPLFLSLLFKLFGSTALIYPYLAQALLSIATVLVIGSFATVLWGDSAARWSVLLLAPQLTLAQYSALLLSETLFAFLFAVWLTLALGSARSAASRPTRFPPTARLLLSAGVAGLACAVRPAAAGLALGTAVALAFRETGRARVWRPLAFGCVALGFLLGANWGVARALRTTTATVPTAGVNLYIGNNPDARLDGGGQASLPPDLERISDPTARNDEAGRRAVSYVLSHPIRSLGLAAVRFGRLVGVNPGRVEVDALRYDGLPGMVAAGWLACEWSIMLLLAGIGYAADASSRPAFAPTIAIGAPYALLLLATFVQTRFRLPLHLLLVPLSAVGLRALCNYGPSRGAAPGTLWRTLRPSVWFWVPIGLLAMGLSVGLLTHAS